MYNVVRINSTLGLYYRDEGIDLGIGDWGRMLPLVKLARVHNTPPEQRPCNKLN